MKYKVLGASDVPLVLVMYECWCWWCTAAGADDVPTWC